MDFLTLAKQRYSCRSYQDKPVEKDKLSQILEAGRVAPTAANRQPQRVYVVQKKEGLAKLNKACKPHGAPLALIVCADENAAWTRGYDDFQSVEVDASIVTDHMMLEAASLGLQSVWLCAFNPAVLKQEFDLPDGIRPVNILAIGYGLGTPASPDRHDTARLPLEQTVIYD